MMRSSLLFILALSGVALAQAEEPRPGGGSVVLDRLVSFPEYAKTDVILLRNIGAEAVDLRGWWLTDSSKNKTNPERSYLFGVKEECSALRGLPPGGVMELKPLTKGNPCGIPFGVSTRDGAHLFNKEDNLIASVSWDWSLQGLVMRRMPDGSYKRLQENKNLHNVLEDFSDLYLFREALQATGLFHKLSAGNGNSSDLMPDFPFKSINDALPYQLPASMQPSLDFSLWPVVYHVKSHDGVPDEGPYTVLAPSSAALKDFFATWGPAKGLSKEQIFALPQFKEVMKAHIIPGAWMTGKLFDGTVMPSASGVDIVATKKGGKITLQTACDDVPPPGEFTCEEQLRFGKCKKDYVTGSGYCLRTCAACNCAIEGCAKVVQPDVYAKNGFVHIVDKVIGPSMEPDSPKTNNMMVTAQAADDLLVAVSNTPEVEPEEEESLAFLELDQPTDLAEPAPTQVLGESEPTSGPVAFISRGANLVSSSVSTAVETSSTHAVGEDSPVLPGTVPLEPGVPMDSEDTQPAVDSTDKDKPSPELVLSTKEPAPSRVAPASAGSSTFIRTG